MMAIYKNTTGREKKNGLDTSLVTDRILTLTARTGWDLNLVSAVWCGG